jgi:hypothetical protein
VTKYSREKWKSRNISYCPTDWLSLQVLRIRARICKRLRSPEIDSASLRSLGGPVRQKGLSYRQARYIGCAESILRLLICLQIRALVCFPNYRFTLELYSGAYLGFCQGGCTFLADLPSPPPPRSGSWSASRFWAGSGSASKQCWSTALFLYFCIT